MMQRDLKREREIAMAEQDATGLKTWRPPAVRAPRSKRIDTRRAIRVLEASLLEQQANEMLYGQFDEELREFTHP